MKAMILAAGLGTRLLPMTGTMPKALVIYEGKTLLEHALDHLALAGIDDVIVNVHHFSDQVKDFIKDLTGYKMNITVSDETDALLETGGGLKKASWFFDDGKPFFVRNVDVISDLDLKELMAFHQSSGAVATLSVRKRQTGRYFLFDGDRLCGWRNTKTGETKWTGEMIPEAAQLAFSGIQVVEPVAFSMMPSRERFSLTEMYLELAPENKIACYIEKNPVWMDMGKIEDLNKKRN